jgi:methylmalonyl-CoA mutase cobalamin-binding domain/chain
LEFEKLTELVIELEVDDIADAVKEALNEGKTAMSILDALTKGMDKVGELYEKKEYYLTELVLAGETMKEAFKILKPKLKVEGEGQEKAKVIIGTVKGDNHDIGKNILGSLLLSAGFEVIDIGMDCPEEKIIKAIKETGAKIIGLSSLLTMTVEEIKNVHEALKKAGLREKVKIIVGGAPLNMELAKRLGADDFADDAVEGVRRIKELVKITVDVKNP